MGNKLFIVVTIIFLSGCAAKISNNIFYKQKAYDGPSKDESELSTYWASTVKIHKSKSLQEGNYEREYTYSVEHIYFPNGKYELTTNVPVNFYRTSQNTIVSGLTYKLIIAFEAGYNYYCNDLRAYPSYKQTSEIPVKCYRIESSYKLPFMAKAKEQIEARHHIIENGEQINIEIIDEKS